MRIRPNHTVLEARVLAIRRSADGVGADVTVTVEANRGAGTPDDMTGAEAGQTLTLFASVPEALEVGGRYRFEVSVLGGPGGERIVIGKTGTLRD